MKFHRAILRSSITALGALALLSMRLALAQTGPAMPAAYLTAFIYDVGGQLTGIIRPDPGDVSSPVYLATRNTYDITSGNLTEIDTGALSSWPAAGTAPSSWTGFTVHQKKLYTYDTMGRKLTEELIGSDSQAYELTQYSYDAMGRVQCVAIRMNVAAYGSLPASACTLGPAGAYGPDRITYTTYDATNRPLTIQRAYGTSLQESYATYTYTPNHLQHTIQDANNNLTTLSYDGLDRLSEKQFPSKTTPGTSSTTDVEQYPLYDANNNRKSLVTRDSQTITYNYDNLNRLTSKLWPSSWGVTNNVYYGYDLRNLQQCANYGSACTYSNNNFAASNGVTTTFDGFGDVNTQSVNLGGTARTMSYQYDADGNRTRVTYPDNNYIQYTYDQLDRLAGALENGSATLVAYSYDTAGQLQQITRGVGGVTTTVLGYDPVSRLSSESHTVASSADNVSFSPVAYTPAGQITSLTISNAEYDPLMDQVGSQNYTTNGLNQYSAVGGVSFSWDARGNLTWDGLTTYSYDLENYLTGATTTPSVALTYDPLGRLYQTSGAATTKFIYDGDRIAMEYDGSGNVLRRYAYGPTGDNPVVWYEGSAVGQSSRRYLHSDHEGSIILVTDGNGATLAVNQYDPYGIRGTHNQGRFQFTGQAFIPELGLYYYKARMYNAALGRFMQTDPIGYKDDLDLYSYVYNDPMNRTDPSGTCTAAAAGRAAGAVLLGGGPEEPIGDAVGAVILVGSCAVVAYESLDALLKAAMAAKEHSSGARPSTEEKHEKGEARKRRDRGGEKGDERRDPPRKRPPDHKGPWPPKEPPREQPPKEQPPKEPEPPKTTDLQNGAN